MAEVAHDPFEGPCSVPGWLVEGGVTLIRSSEYSQLPERDWHLRWSELITGGLDVVIVPGTHAGLTQGAGAEMLASTITAAIRRGPGFDRSDAA